MPENVAKLLGQLAADDAQQRASAAEHLARLGEGARVASVALVRSAADADESTRDWVMASLEGLGPPPVEAVDELTQLLADSRPDVAYWAATLLGRLGPAAVNVVAALSAALHADSGTSVQERAAWALGQIGPGAHAAKDALEQAAATSDQPRLARLAAESLKKIDSSAG